MLLPYGHPMSRLKVRKGLDNICFAKVICNWKHARTFPDNLIFNKTFHNFIEKFTNHTRRKTFLRAYAFLDNMIAFYL